jgi:acyl-CoA synthetase (AMP-forming)/AMP-acid ligase II
MVTYNLADLFELVADKVADWDAIVTDDKRFTYAQLEERANRLAHFMQGQGVKPGDHVALHLRNDNEYIEAMLAAYKLRAVPVNINYNYVEAELDYVYNDADAVVLLVHREFVPRAEAVVGSVPTLKTQLVVDDGSDNATPDGWFDYEAALADSLPERDFASRSSDDVYIIYTGGTTGMPKGVMWRHEDIFFASLGGGDPDRSKGPITSPEQLAERLPEYQMASIAAPPFMHAAAQWTALGQMLSGGKLLIPAHGNFDVPAILQAAADENAVAMTVVGDAMSTPIADELQANPGKYDLSSLFVIASGGAIMSPSVKARLLQLLPGKMILDGLGSSETGVMGSKTSGMGEEETDEPKFTVSDSVQVLDDDLNPIAPGSGIVGKLAQGGHVPLGYYNAPEKSATTFVEANGQRWALPGDLATVEADNTITLLGRGSTSINTGGEKVFPEEVESQLKAHEHIYDTVVVGVPDERWGQAVTAVVQLRPDTGLDHEQLKEFCRSRLAGYKIPRHLVFCDNIKRSPAGKANYPWAKQYALDALGMTA